MTKLIGVLLRIIATLGRASAGVCRRAVVTKRSVTRILALILTPSVGTASAPSNYT